jgi:hypothetical protein
MQVKFKSYKYAQISFDRVLRMFSILQVSQ